MACFAEYEALLATVGHVHHALDVVLDLLVVRVHAVVDVSLQLVVVVGDVFHLFFDAVVEGGDQGVKVCDVPTEVFELRRALFAECVDDGVVHFDLAGAFVDVVVPLLVLDELGFGKPCVGLRDHVREFVPHTCELLLDLVPK